MKKLRNFIMFKCFFFPEPESCQAHPRNCRTGAMLHLVGSAPPVDWCFLPPTTPLLATVPFQATIWAPKELNAWRLCWKQTARCELSALSVCLITDVCVVISAFHFLFAFCGMLVCENRLGVGRLGGIQEVGRLGVSGMNKWRGQIESFANVFK